MLDDETVVNLLVEDNVEFDAKLVAIVDFDVWLDPMMFEELEPEVCAGTKGCRTRSPGAGKSTLSFPLPK